MEIKIEYFRDSNKHTLNDLYSDTRIEAPEETESDKDLALPARVAGNAEVWLSICNTRKKIPL